MSAASTNLHFRNVYKVFWNAGLGPFTTRGGTWRLKTLHIHKVYKGLLHASSGPFTAPRFDKDYKGNSKRFANQVCRFHKPPFPQRL